MAVGYADVTAQIDHPDLGDPEATHLANQAMNLPPLVTGKVVTLEELDLLRYKVLVERAQKLQLLLEKKASEFRQAQEQQHTNAVELGALLDGFGVKYALDFHKNHITEDGKVVPTGPR